MDDAFLLAAGIGGALIALIHGHLGRTIVLPAVTGGSGPVRRINTAVFQLSTLYWFTGGLALIAAVFFFNQDERTIIAAVVSFLYLTGAAGNFWATRGRHPGWALLVMVGAMALLGA